LRTCIEFYTDWKVCGEAENGELAIQRVEELSPDVVILDWRMPVMDGVEAARQIHRRHPQTPMVMFVMHATEKVSLDARAAGVTYVLSKFDQSGRGLIDSIAEILRLPGPDL